MLMDVKDKHGREHVLVGTDLLADIKEIVQEKDNRKSDANQPEADRKFTASNTQMERQSSDSHNKIAALAKTDPKDIELKLEKYSKSLETELTSINKLKIESKRVKTKVKLYVERYSAYIESGNVDALHGLALEVRVYKNQIQRALENGSKKNKKWDDEKLSYERKNLIRILNNPTLLKKYTKGQINNFRMLLNTIPTSLIESIERAGYRSESGANYDWQAIKQTAQYLVKKHDNSFYMRNRLHIKRAIFALVFFSLIGSGVWFFYYSRNPKAAQMQTAALGLIETSKDKVQEYIAIFNGEKSKNELAAFEAKKFDDKGEFYSYYAPLAKAICSGTNLDPRIPLAQAYWESGMKSDLFTKYKNLFGIKAGKNYSGQTVTLETDEVFNGKDTSITDVFRAYTNIYNCFMDYKDKLSKPWYNGILKKETYQEQISCLIKWSTNPEYCNTILTEVESFKID